MITVKNLHISANFVHSASRSRRRSYDRLSDEDENEPVTDRSYVSGHSEEAGQGRRIRGHLPLEDVRRVVNLLSMLAMFLALSMCFSNGSQVRLKYHMYMGDRYSYKVTRYVRTVLFCYARKSFRRSFTHSNFVCETLSHLQQPVPLRRSVVACNVVAMCVEVVAFTLIAALFCCITIRGRRGVGYAACLISMAIFCAMISAITNSVALVIDLEEVSVCK